MSAQIHAVAAVVDGLGNAADLTVGIEDDGRDIGPPQEFERGCQSRGPCAGDDRDFAVIVAGGHRNRHSIRAVFDEEKLAACQEIPNEGKAGRPALGDEVVHTQDPDTEGHGSGVDCDPDHANSREACKLDARVLEPAILNTKVIDST